MTAPAWTVSASGTLTTITAAITGTTNGTTAAGNATLHFASTPAGVVAGQLISDTTAPTVIPFGTYVVSTTGTTVVMSANATGAGVGGTDTISFSNEINPAAAIDATDSTYVARADISALANGETIELRAYVTALASGIYRCIRKGSFTSNGGFITPIVDWPFWASDQATFITIKQVSGSARSIPWTLERQ